MRGDQVWPEVSPRPHDTGLVTLASQRFSEFARTRHSWFAGGCVTAPPGAPAVIYGGLDAVGIAYTGAVYAGGADTDLRLFGKPESSKTAHGCGGGDRRNH